MQKVRYAQDEEDYYSGKTCAVYIVSLYQGIIHFEEIHFKENRPDSIGYGMNPDTATAMACCKKCNSIITSAPNLIGGVKDWCNCKA